MVENKYYLTNFIFRLINILISGTYSNLGFPSDEFGQLIAQFIEIRRVGHGHVAYTYMGLTSLNDTDSKQ